MNSKTSKLIRRFARDTGRTYQSVKRFWFSLPTDLRGEARESMIFDLCQSDRSKTKSS